MIRATSVLAAIIVGLVAPLARADDVRIDRVASIFAMRPATIQCHTADEDPEIQFAWGYTYLPWDYAVVDDVLCTALVAALDGLPFEDAMVAEAVLTVTHEAYHVRRWPGRGSERKVECKAIRHFKVAGQLFGLSKSVVDRLYPFAAWSHYRLGVLVPEYADRSCEVADPWG